MPSVITLASIIVTKPAEEAYTPQIISPPTTLIPKNVFVNGFSVVTVGDTYITHTAEDTHTQPPVITNGLNVFANGVEVTVFGSLLTGCLVPLAPEITTNVFIAGPNPV